MFKASEGEFGGWLDNMIFGTCYHNVSVNRINIWGRVEGLHMETPSHTDETIDASFGEADKGWSITTGSSVKIGR